MFSIMNNPAQLLERLPQKLLKNGWIRLSTSPASRLSVDHATARGVTSDNWDQDLESGFLQGGIVELSLSGGLALGTSLALAACRRAQEQSHVRYGQNVWCAFVDPRGSLYAPGVAASGVDLARLLVLRPDATNLSRVALRLVEARTFPVVVIDTAGVPGAGLDVSLAPWVQVVRRLERALHSTSNTVILLTHQHAKRPLPLPVTRRYELVRSTNREITFQVTRDTKMQNLLSGQFTVRQILRRRVDDLCEPVVQQSAC